MAESEIEGRKASSVDPVKVISLRVARCAKVCNVASGKVEVPEHSLAIRLPDLLLPVTSALGLATTQVWRLADAACSRQITDPNKHSVGTLDGWFLNVILLLDTI